MVAELKPAPERDFRGPGCDDRCRVIHAFQHGEFGRQEFLLHSPDAHERYGRLQAGADRGFDFDVVRTGPLAIDLDGMRVAVDGVGVELTSLELQILLCVARRRGAVVRVPELMREVYGFESGPGLLGQDAHLARVHVSRLRAKLGPAKSLIETVFGIGYRLGMAPSDATIPPYVRATGCSTALNGRWALRWKECRACESNARPHKARGYCRACYKRLCEQCMLSTGGSS